jgi:hypothetical protein
MNMGRKPEAARACEHRVLAQGPNAQVQVCQQCGTLSLNVGAVTLRFHPAALESLWNTLGEALLALHAEAKSEVLSFAKSPPRGSA